MAAFALNVAQLTVYPIKASNPVVSGVHLCSVLHRGSDCLLASRAARALLLTRPGTLQPGLSRFKQS